MHANLILAIFLAAATAPHPDGTQFARTYKQGEKETYVSSIDTEMLGHHSLSIDIGVTAIKVDDEGKTTVLVHMSNKQASGEGSDTTVLPTDAKVQIGAHSMPESYPVAQGDASLFGPLLFLAGSTIDKPVNVGQEEPLSWSGGPISFDGSIKVLSIQPEKKSLIALVKVKLRAGGQDAGVLSLTSSYDLSDGALIQSIGDLDIGGMKEHLKFVRKAQG